MTIHEVNLNEEVLDQLIRFSEDWAGEDSCYGYRSNDKSDIEGNRIFFAEDGNTVIGYAKVVASGATPIIEPTTDPRGQRTCYIADHEGNLIEIGAFVKE